MREAKSERERRLGKRWRLAESQKVEVLSTDHCRAKAAAAATVAVAAAPRRMMRISNARTAAGIELGMGNEIGLGSENAGPSVPLVASHFWVNLFQFHLILIANGFKIEFQCYHFWGRLTNGPQFALDPDMGTGTWGMGHVAAFVCADSACVCFPCNAGATNNLLRIRHRPGLGWDCNWERALGAGAGAGSSPAQISDSCCLS